jgi:phosphotransferase system HPr (HPr) family protein
MADPRAARRPETSEPTPVGVPFSLDEAGAAALDRVLRETDHRDRLAVEARDLFRLDLLLRRGVHAELSRRFCHRLAEEAERVEYGLLDVGARGNRAYAFFTEVVTATRWCARAVHALLHLRGRIVRYLGEREDLAAFRRDLDACLRWLAARLAVLLAAAREEAEGTLRLALPAEPYDVELLRGEEARWRLPQDVDAAETADERERIAHLATSLLTLADEFSRLPVPATAQPAAYAAFVRTGFTPSTAHAARVRMHAIQSTYDTAVAATPLEASDPTLKVFRGYVSILLHLLEATAYLLQVHDRLDADGRSAAVVERVARLLDGPALLDWAVRFGCSNSAACFLEARRSAEALLQRYARTREATLPLPPGRKLHLRPAGLIVRVVQHHGMPVTMRMGDQEVDARQLMDVILLAASHPDATHVGFRGDDRPLRDLQDLFEHRLGEDGLDGMPASLAYLRETSRPPAGPR